MINPNVTIVIPAYNSEKTLGFAISACLKQDYPASLIEIIVVDDGSTDTTKDIAMSFGVKYIHQVNSGPATARNNGYKNASGEIVAYLDSDCVPQKYWVSKMIRQYTSESVVCVGSRYGIANRNSLVACCIYFEFLVRYKRMPRHPKFLGSHGYSFRRSFLEEMGGYSEEYKMASHEDNELAYRIVAKGYYTVFDKSNIVKHFFPVSFLKYLRIQFWHGYWRMKLYVDHPRMVTGDDYSDIWDYMQPPLMLTILALSFLMCFPSIRIIQFFLLLCLISLQIPITYSIIKLCQKKRYVYYIPFGVFRALSRSLGMALGILKFWVLRKK